MSNGAPIQTDALPYVRPTKPGGNQNYVDEVAAGFSKLPAKALDDDLNVLYDAVNRPLPDDSVGPPQILDRSITYNQIALKTLTSAEIADKTITSGQIANGTITTALLDPNIVVPIGPNYITNAMLQNGCVTDSKVTSITWPKITGAPTTYPPSGAAGGDLAGTYPNPTVRADLIPTALPPSGPASGDLVGTYPAPVIASGAVNRSKTAADLWLVPVPSGADVNRVLTVSVGATDPVLRWQDSPPAQLLPGQVSTMYITDAPNGVTDAKISSVSWSKVTGVPAGLPPSGPAGGDLSGTYPNPTIKAGVIPSSLPPSGPATGDLSGTYPAPVVGAGKITPGKLDRAYIESGQVAGGDLAGTYPAPTLRPGAIPSSLPPSGPAGGDLTGTYPNPTLLPSLKTWIVSGTTITPADTTKKVAILGDGGTVYGQIVLGAATAKSRLQAANAVPQATWTVNRDWSNSNAQDDATKSSWGLQLRVDSDDFVIQRSPAGSTTQTSLLALNNAGALTVPGYVQAAQGLFITPACFVSNFMSAGAPVMQVSSNLQGQGTTVAGKPTWFTRWNADGDQFEVWRQAANGGAYSTPLICRGSDGKTACTLANNSINSAMISPGSTVRNYQRAGLPANYNSNNVINQWVTVTSVVYTNVGAWIFLLGDYALQYSGQASPGIEILMAYFMDSSQLSGQRWLPGSTAGGIVTMPLPTMSCAASIGAGAHTYYLKCYIVGAANANVTARSDNLGGFWVMEMS